MCGVLALLFIAVPALEIFLIVKVGSAIGAAATVGIIFATGIGGAALARHQGLAALRGVQIALARGERIGGSLIEGALVLCAGCLLLTPGFVTDAVGFALLVPPIRNVAATVIARRLAARAQAQIVVGFGPGAGRATGRPPNRDDRADGNARDDRADGKARDGRRRDDSDPPPPGVIDV